MTVIDAPTGNPAFPVHWDDPADANRHLLDGQDA